MEKKTLHLNLKKKWFDMILSGEKTEEYREIKEHWIKQLMNEPFNRMCKDLRDVIHSIDCCPNGSLMNFSSVTFSNGMAKNAPRFEIEFKGIEIETSNRSEWGAEENIYYFIIKLGKVLNVRTPTNNI